MRALCWAGTVFLLSLLGVGSVARAQTGGVLPASPRLDRSFDLQLFHPAVGSQSFITLDSAEVLEHGLWHFGLVANYAREPFSYTLASANSDGSFGATAKTVPVLHLAAAELVAAVGIRNRFELGVAVPLATTWGGDAFNRFGVSTSTATTVVGIGDLRVEGKSEIVGFGYDRAFLLSLSAGATLPTGDDSAFMGEKTVSGRARLLLEYQLGERLRALVMAGGLLRKKSQFLGTPESHAFIYGAAIEVKPELRIGVLAEVTGRAASRYFDTNPVEANAAMRFYLPSMLNLLMGAGLGLNRGIGSPVVRAFVGMGWAPDYRDRDHDGIPDIDDHCPDEPEDLDGFQDADGCPEPDNDGDGIPDASDKCPNDPEDFDGFQDEDGCPDPDNDGDGIPDIKDACPNEKEDGKGKRPSDGCPSTLEDSDGDGVPDVKDKCPDEPEDKDGFQDDDGCSDYDNDGDGIPDAYDACPNEPEDFDGFEDDDGCPDPDNDHDGIPDVKDKCPNQPETYDNFKDEDGCPDGTALVALGERDNKVSMADRITFFQAGGGKPVLSANSQLLMGLLARVIKGHPEVTTLRIEVRAKDLTKEATEERGQAVLQALVKNGIEAQRLKVAGLGPGRTRVEFVVESRSRPKRATMPIPTSGPDPGASPEGTSPEGVSPEGVSPEGVSPEGVSPEGVSPEPAPSPENAPGPEPAGSAPPAPAPVEGAE